jgi:hypothetical protein
MFGNGLSEDELYLVLLILTTVHLYPFSICNLAVIRTVLDAAKNQKLNKYAIASSTTLTKRRLEKFLQVELLLKALFKKEVYDDMHGSYNITFDGWTASNKHVFYAYIVSWISKDWVQRKFLVKFKAFPFVRLELLHDGDNAHDLD